MQKDPIPAMIYKPSDNIIQHIKQFEGADMKKQNEQFGGDAIASKAVEFSKIMWGLTDKLTQGQLDGLFGTYYNISPNTFKKKILSLAVVAANNPTEENNKALYDCIANRYTWAAKQYQNGIKRRCTAEANMML